MQTLISEWLHNPLVIAALGIACSIAFQKSQKALVEHRAEQKRRDNVLHDLSAVVCTLSDDVMRLTKILSDAHEMQEKAQAGTARACEAIAVATDRHRASVERFGKLLLGPDAGKDALQTPTEGDKSRLYDEMSYRAAGRSPAEAASLAELDSIKDAAIYPSE